MRARVASSERTEPAREWLTRHSCCRDARRDAGRRSRAVEPGARIRLRGQAEVGTNGGAPGDLYVEVQQEPDPDPVFARDGFDLHRTVDVAVTTLELGGEVLVGTLDGDVRVRISPGTRPGTRLRVRGRGVPLLQGKGRGDLIVTLRSDFSDLLQSIFTGRDA